LKEAVINHGLNFIKNNNPNFDDIKMLEIKYGLESLYLTITKAIIIFSLAFILGTFKEMIIMLVIFNILRNSGFGLHASKTWICLLSSLLIFILFPLISKYIIIPQYLQIFLGIISIVLFYLYAPADTAKRPIIKKERRDILKFKTTIRCIILVFIMVLIRNNTLSNLIIFGIYSELILILPITYKLFNFSYNNYKNYKV